MENLKNSGIYMILNIQNVKVYIGSSKNLHSRKLSHFKTLKNNKHYNYHLQAAYNKYGKENFNFIVLERDVPTEQLRIRENFYILQYDSLNPQKGYNLSIPKEDENLYTREETLEKKRRIAYIQHYGEISEEEYLAWKKEKNKPPITPEEFKENAIKKFGKPLYGICAKTNEILKEYPSVSLAIQELGPRTQRVINTDYTIKGLKLIFQKDYDPNQDYRKQYKPRYIKKGVFKGYPLEITNIETGEIVICDNISTAMEQYNMTKNGINKVLYKERKTYKGYTFKLLK